jgi:hypothetical protein
MARIKKVINSVFIKTKSWKEIEYFDESWKKRIFEMSEFIAPGQTVMDLGCGKMWLKEYLDANNRYIPVDYKDRGDGCIICDFKRHQFPNIAADIAFISGSLEYIKDYEWFISAACNKSQRVILSYCTTDEFPHISERKLLAWVNHLSMSAVINIFKKNRFMLVKSKLSKSNDSIFVFDKQ